MQGTINELPFLEYAQSAIPSGGTLLVSALSSVPQSEHVPDPLPR